MSGNAAHQRWSGGRRRRTTSQIIGAREAAAIAATLGRELRAARRTRRLTQAQVGASVGVTHARIGDLERGNGAGAPLGLWIAMGMAVGRPIEIAASREVEFEPRDAGHLAAQEHILRLAQANGIRGTLNCPPVLPRTRPGSTSGYATIATRPSASSKSGTDSMTSGLVRAHSSASSWRPERWPQALAATLRHIGSRAVGCSARQQRIVLSSDVIGQSWPLSSPVRPVDGSVL